MELKAMEKGSLRSRTATLMQCKKGTLKKLAGAHFFSLNHNIIIFNFRPLRHRERRKFLRTALKELALILTDQPGLLGPKVGAVN